MPQNTTPRSSNQRRLEVKDGTHTSTRTHAHVHAHPRSNTRYKLSLGIVEGDRREKRAVRWMSALLRYLSVGSRATSLPLFSFSLFYLQTIKEAPRYKLIMIVDQGTDNYRHTGVAPIPVAGSCSMCSIPPSTTPDLDKARAVYS